MKRTILSTLKYIITLSIAIAILWWLFKDMELADFVARLREVDYGWVYLSIGFSIVAFWARAYRWNLLFKPLKIHVSTFRLTIAVIVGYLANLAFPRMGEVSRCAVIKRTDDVPISTSIGTVVTERGVDLICLLLLLAGSLAVEFKKISSLLSGMVEQIWSKLSLSQLLIISGVSVAILAGLWWAILKFRSSTRFGRLKEFLLNLWYGVSSISKMKSPVKFLLSTVVLWLSYYLMSYVIVFSMEETAWLDMKAGLVLLAMGGIGMAMPVQGGFGTYHAFVAGILLWYGIEEKTGVFFATLLHTSQVITAMVLGGLALLVVVFLPRKKQVDNEAQNKNTKPGSVSYQNLEGKRA